MHHSHTHDAAPKRWPACKTSKGTRKRILPNFFFSILGVKKITRPSAGGVDMSHHADPLRQTNQPKPLAKLLIFPWQMFRRAASFQTLELRPAILFPQIRTTLTLTPIVILHPDSFTQGLLFCRTDFRYNFNFLRPTVNCYVFRIILTSNSYHTAHSVSFYLDWLLRLIEKKHYGRINISLIWLAAKYT